MSLLAVDYSFSRPSFAEIKSKGYVAVGRYLGGSPDKQITRAEANGLLAAGLKIWLVWEGAANRAAQGKGAGIADAQAALSAAHAVGYPDSAPIFFAVDFDAQPAAVRPYFEGVKSVLGPRTGVYGGYNITRGVADLAPYRWQTVAWSGGKVDANAHLYQRSTMTHPIAGCDEDVIQKTFPMWGSTPAKPTPTVSGSSGRNVERAIAALDRAISLAKSPVRIKTLRAARRLLVGLRKHR